jgi:Ca2+-binding RTX toxin-like protein
VSNTAGLSAALKTAHDGDTILLNAGTYSGLAIKNLSFASGVNIVSKDLAHEAVLNNFTVTGANGLHFSNVELQTTGTATNAWAFQVDGSKNVSFDHVSVHGSMDGNAQNDMEGISVLGSSNVSITNSEFQQLFRAVGFGNTNGVTISGNSFHDLRTTGIMGAQTSNVQINNNTFTNFKPMAGDHPDAIQFLTTATTAASHDISITGNVMTRGNGDAIQGIFLRDEIGTMPYANVKIASNLLVGEGYNGVAVLGGQNLQITDNTLISYDGKTNVNWFLVQNADKVVASGNSATQIGFDHVTNLVETKDTINQVATDGGKAALTAWQNTHVGTSFAISDAQVAALTGAPSTPGSVASPVSVAPPTLTAPGTSASLAVNGVVTVSSSYTLDSTANALVLKGSTNIDGTGNNNGDVLTGSAGNNHITGGTGADTIDGNGGADTLTGGAGDDTYYVSGSTTLVVEQPGGGTDTVIARGDYTLTGNVENLVINNTVTNSWAGTGNQLNNKITGNAGDNKLDGGAGNDTVNGGAGNDLIIGGAGNDQLTGGAGSDTFRFLAGSGHDTITDFGAGDTLDISAYLKLGLKPILQDAGSDVTLTFSTGDSIKLMGVHAADLHASSLGFVS